MEERAVDDKSKKKKEGKNSSFRIQRSVSGSDENEGERHLKPKTGNLMK